MKKLIGSLSVLPLLAAGSLLVGSSAQAADLTFPPAPGPFANVYAIASPAGSANGVNVKISGGTASFDFVTTQGYTVSLATGSFSQFGVLPTPGEIKDFTLPFPLLGTPGVTQTPKVIPAFLDLDGGAGDSLFDLQSVITPTFTTSGPSTIVSFGFAGLFTQGTEAYSGIGTISATFVGLSPTDIIDLASTPDGLTTSWSGTFTLVPTVPEPSSVAGLIVFAGASTLLLKRRQKS